MDSVAKLLYDRELCWPYSTEVFGDKERYNSGLNIILLQKPRHFLEKRSLTKFGDRLELSNHICSFIEQHTARRILNSNIE